MFGQLPASRPARAFGKGEWTGLVGACVLHVGALLLGGGQADALPPPLPSDAIYPIVFPRPPERALQVPEQSGPDGLAPPATPLRIDWPSGDIPNLDLTGEPIEVELGVDPRELVGSSLTDASLRGSPFGVPRGGAGGSVREEALDLPLRLLRTPQPRYPEWLRRAGITGVVTVEFVVDTSGRVEMRSTEILEATRNEFADAVIRALRGARFSPGTVRGRPVRVKVRQDFRFRIGR